MFDWIVANWSYILSGIFAFITFASIVVKLTPSKKDDSFLTSLVNVLDKFSVAKTARDKELIEMAKKGLAEEEKK